MKLIPVGPHIRSRARDRVFLVVAVVRDPAGAKGIADIAFTGEDTNPTVLRNGRLRL